MIVSVSLKSHGAVPGDATPIVRALADLVESYGAMNCASHEQNIILPHIPAICHAYEGLQNAELATANIGHLGHYRLPGDGSLWAGNRAFNPIAQEIAQRFDNLKNRK